MPKYCKDCSQKIGFFKKKHYCQLCLCHFCDRCFSKVKENESKLVPKLCRFTRPTCLKCVVFHSQINRDHLFLLGNKQLTEFLTSNNISILHCREKYHLIDLVMEFAQTRGQMSGHDIQMEMQRKEHLQMLQENERLRKEEEDDQMRHEDDEENDNTNSTFEFHNVQRDLSDIVNNTLDADNNDINTSNEASNIPNINTSSTNLDENVNNNVDGIDASTTTTENTRDVNATHLTNEEEEEEESTSNTENNSTAGSPFHQASGKWSSMNNIKGEDEINLLTVLELKQILTANFIDYRGCVEKQELIEKVRWLYKSEKKAKDTLANDPDAYERDVCKICMDCTIDCVLLDCGHLVACHNCGKRLSHCPVCRRMVVRVVHVFRT